MIILINKLLTINNKCKISAVGVFQAKLCILSLKTGN